MIAVGRSGSSALPVALLAGGLLFLAVTGVLRSGQGALLFLASGTGPERARDSRYVYVIAAMLLPTLAVAADALIRFKWQLVIPIVAVLLVGLPGNIHLMMNPEPYFANSQATRKTIVAIPTLPNADQLQGSTRWIPLEGGRFAAEGLTYGWIADAAADGKFPKASTLNPTVRATAILRLFLVPKQVNTPVSCAVAPKTVVLELQHQQMITLQGGPAYVWYAPVGHAKSAIQLYKAGSYVTLAGPLRVRINPGAGCEALLVSTAVADAAAAGAEAAPVTDLVDVPRHTRRLFMAVALIVLGVYLFSARRPDGVRRGDRRRHHRGSRARARRHQHAVAGEVPRPRGAPIRRPQGRHLRHRHVDRRAAAVFRRQGDRADLAREQARQIVLTATMFTNALVVAATVFMLMLVCMLFARRRAAR